MKNKQELEIELKELNTKFDDLKLVFDEFISRYPKNKLEYLWELKAQQMLKLLPILDDLERTIIAINNNTDIYPIIEGNKLIYNKLKSIVSNE